jgi:sugar transferase (PEP-CTERM/EpsH1 system associated)
MRVLSISPRQCWPPVSGAKLRDYFFIKALGENAALTHVFFAEDGTPVPTAQEFPFCEKVVAVARPRMYTPAKIAAGFVGRWPLPVINYFSREMEQALASIAAQTTFDLVRVDSIHMAPYAESLRRKLEAPMIYDWHNIESEAMQRYSRQASSPAHKLYAAFTARRLAAFEKRLLREAFGHVVCSEREKQLLQSIAPEARIAVIENGVDSGYFSDFGRPITRRQGIVFVGSMSYHANVDGATWFARTVWPTVRERHPGWKLTIVGSNPAPAVRMLETVPGVEVTGTVSDVRPYYAEAVAAIVPLRIGGGTRLKILEAMAAGVPVVSTALGAEGLPVTGGEDILIAETAEQWSLQLGALAKQDDTWKRLAEQGRSLVRTRYDWRTLGEALYQTYLRWLGV